MKSLVVLLFFGIGIWRGYATTQTFPYIATYDFITIWLLGFVLCAIGSIAYLRKSSRRYAALFWISGIGLVAMCYLALGVTTWAGLNRWDELGRPVPLESRPPAL